MDQITDPGSLQSAFCIDHVSAVSALYGVLARLGIHMPLTLIHLVLVLAAACRVHSAWLSTWQVGNLPKCIDSRR